MHIIKGITVLEKFLQLSVSTIRHVPYQTAVDMEHAMRSMTVFVEIHGLDTVAIYLIVPRLTVPDMVLVNKVGTVCVYYVHCTVYTPHQSRCILHTAILIINAVTSLIKPVVTFYRTNLKKLVSLIKLAVILNPSHFSNN